mgnify:CR=1 FL=1|jgi:hypothetical protein
MLRERSPEDMDMTGWTMTDVFVSCWKSGIFRGHSLIGISKTNEEAVASVAVKSEAGHSGAKSDPQGEQGCIVTRRALVHDNQFIPMGDWLDDGLDDMNAEEGITGAPKKGSRYILTFGNLDFDKRTRFSV